MSSEKPFGIMRDENVSAEEQEKAFRSAVSDAGKKVLCLTDQMYQERWSVERVEADLYAQRSTTKEDCKIIVTLKEVHDIILEYNRESAPEEIKVPDKHIKRLNQLATEMGIPESGTSEKPVPPAHTLLMLVKTVMNDPTAESIPARYERVHSLPSAVEELLKSYKEWLEVQPLASMAPIVARHNIDRASLDK